MLTGCPDCVIKHLSSALENNLEMTLGYPDHWRRVVGGLTEAMYECDESNHELALRIQELRRKFADTNYSGDITEDIEVLLDAVLEVRILESVKTPQEVLP